MKNYLIILQVWFLSLEKQKIKVIQASSDIEAEGIAEREVRAIKGWQGHKTHWVVLECESDGKPIPPKKPIKLNWKERLTGRFWRTQKDGE